MKFDYSSWKFQILSVVFGILFVRNNLNGYWSSLLQNYYQNIITL